MVDAGHSSQCDDGGRSLGGLDRAALLDTLGESSGETGSELGVSEDQLLEPLAVDLEELGVAQGLHRRRPLRSRQDRELAQYRARPERVEDGGLAVPLRNDPHAAGHHEVQAVTGVARVKDPLPR